MFTCCPACKTVFHITATELKAADGTVICGVCDATFDALDSLSETRPAEEAAPDSAGPAEAGSGRAEDEPGESVRDEDEFLEEIESLIGSEESSDEPPGALQPLFQVPSPRQSSRFEMRDYADEDLEQIPDPDSVFRIDELPEDGPADGSSPFVGDDETPVPEDPTVTETPSSSGPDVEGVVREERLTPRAVPATKDPRQEEEEDDSADGLPGFFEDRRGVPWFKVAATIVAMLVLAGTWVHVQRGKLMREPAAEAVLGPVYGALRIEANPEWKPGDYRVLRSEAIATTDFRGDLRVQVEFMNGASFAQPYPVIRIVLQDRFGQRIGVHDIAPERYLETSSGGARLGAGERVRTSVAVPDPGERAEGFRVDLCLELAARGLVCAPEPFR